MKYCDAIYVSTIDLWEDDITDDCQMIFDLAACKRSRVFLVRGLEGGRVCWALERRMKYLCQCVRVSDTNCRG